MSGWKGVNSVQLAVCNLVSFPFFYTRVTVLLLLFGYKVVRAGREGQAGNLYIKADIYGYYQQSYLPLTPLQTRYRFEIGK